MKKIVIDPDVNEKLMSIVDNCLHQIFDYVEEMHIEDEKLKLGYIYHVIDLMQKTVDKLSEEKGCKFVKENDI